MHINFLWQFSVYRIYSIQTINYKKMITEIETQDKITIDRTLKDELTKDLSPDDLSKIKKGFDLYKGVVNLQQFIIIMLQSLYNKTEFHKRKLQILTFIQMFLLIDLKNLEKIRFEDFTNYLIDRQVSKIKNDQYQLFPCQSLNDLNIQGDTVFPLSGCSNFAVLESSKKQVTLIQPKTYKKMKTLSFGGNIINNIIYLQDEEVYCIATNDKHLNFYETVDDTLIRRFQTPDTIHFLLYIAANNLIISGSTNGHIYEWSSKKILANLKKNQKGDSQKQKLPKVNPQDQYKLFLLNKVIKNQSDLTCFDYLHSLEILITGCNDSLVRLYEVRTNGLKMNKELDGHYKGIKGIAVSQNYKIIVSCSFDFDVLVWNAYLEHPIARLQGHEAPLMSVYCPKKHDIIISLDSKSVLKIWSSQKFHLIQNIIIFQSNPINTSIRLCYKQQSNIAIVYTKKLLFYRYSVNYNPRLTDDHQIHAIQYSSKNLQIYVGSFKSLKVWSVQTGIQKRTYANITQSQITVLEIDERHRRCFIGCINGNIMSLDLFSGLVIVKYSSHKSQISFLHYNSLNNLLISGSWDRKIKIHNDTHHLQKIQSRQNVLRNINNIGQKDLSGGAFSINQFLIATHCKTNAIYVWDFEKCYLEAKLVLPADVCQVQFICPYPLILVSDVKGSIYIFTSKHHTSGPYKMLAQWKNMYSIQRSSQITYIKPIFDPVTKQCQIILGDQYGYIRVANITAFIQSNKINPVTPEMLGNKNPFRIQDYNYKGGSQSTSNTHDFSKYNLSNLVPPSTVKQKIQIKAHNQKINYVTFINQSKQQMILSASSDHLVKMWSYNGQQRGVLKQGLKQNQGWQYNINQKWQNNQAKLYDKIKNQLQSTQADYMFRKRMDSVPFTVGEKFQEASNEDIYNNLKEIDSYLHKNNKQVGGRLY